MTNEEIKKPVRLLIEWCTELGLQNVARTWTDDGPIKGLRYYQTKHMAVIEYSAYETAIKAIKAELKRTGGTVPILTEVLKELGE